ncbi:MAG TPA: redoxin domain-containing protein [Fimbriimonadaceae bacterium]|nr:redoxin domain-containing protein [Fimbriimonadaceae bacterium]
MNRIKTMGFAVACIAASVVYAQSQQATAKVGQAAPNFTLTDSNGKNVSLSDYKGKYVVLEWTNHDCPIVVGHYKSGNMQQTQKWATGKGVVWLAIVSSAPGKQGHVTGPEANDIMKEKGHNVSAMLLDPNGNVGRTYGAKTTPHMYIISPDGTLLYNGAIDDKKERNHVIAGLEEAMAGKALTVPTSQPYGCGVKY